MVTKIIDRKKASVEMPVVSRQFIDESFTRVTGASLLSGNKVRLLIDATENYPAWLEAIRSAKDRIYFESYIIHDDKQGELFSDELIKKAAEGVEVKLVYDWMGGFSTSRRFWKRLIRGGVEVRCYNPPNIADPLGVFSRDHRKCIVVDGRIAFVSGLCVGQDWVGSPGSDSPPWRDTGVELTGPAVADVEDAFATIWATMGTPLDAKRVVRRTDIAPEGSTNVRVVQSAPAAAHIYRFDQILAAAARETMWLTDAYFVGVPSYLQSMKSAAMDGVDVRILVPQATDIAVIRDTTRSTYRSLLEAGVRVFEWNGTMVHAKTAVFDGRFSRVGSSNMNIASWFGNYELDVIVEDEDFGREMNEMFLRDLANSTEIVLSDTAKSARTRRRMPRRPRKGAGSVRKATAGAINAATSIGSAIAKKSQLGPAEARLLFMVGILPLIYAILLVFFPRGASIPLIALLLLFAVPTLFKAVQNYRKS